MKLVNKVKSSWTLIVEFIYDLKLHQYVCLNYAECSIVIRKIDLNVTSTLAACPFLSFIHPLLNFRRIKTIFMLNMNISCDCVQFLVNKKLYIISSSNLSSYILNLQQCWNLVIFVLYMYIFISFAYIGQCFLGP